MIVIVMLSVTGMTSSTVAELISVVLSAILSHLDSIFICKYTKRSFRFRSIVLKTLLFMCNSWCWLFFSAFPYSVLNKHFGCFEFRILIFFQLKSDSMPIFNSGSVLSNIFHFWDSFCQLKPFVKTCIFVNTFDVCKTIYITLAKGLLYMSISLMCTTTRVIYKLFKVTDSVYGKIIYNDTFSLLLIYVVIYSAR